MDENEINEIGKELNVNKSDVNLVNNVIPKHRKFDESFRRNTHFIRPKYVQSRRITNFSIGFIPKKTTSFEDISHTPPQINQTCYALNIDCVRYREEIIFEYRTWVSIVS